MMESENTRKDRIRDEKIRLKIRVAPVNGKMRESHLRWFGRVSEERD